MVDSFIIARNPIPTDTPEREADVEAQQAPANLEKAFGSLAGQTNSSVKGFVDRHWHDDIMADTKTPEKMLSPDEFEAEYQLGPDHKPTGPISEYSAKSIAEAVRKRQAAERVWERYSSAHSAPINMLTGMAGSMLDPIDAATLLVPGIGEERVAYALAKAGYGAKTSIVAGKVAAGASGAMVGTAATMPIRYVANRDELYDYTAREAFTELMYAAPLGAFMHAGLMPALGYGAAKLVGAKPAPYFHNEYWQTGLAPEDMTPKELKLNIQMGVAEGLRTAEATPPSIGHIDELAHMNAINRQIQHKSTFAQLITERPVDNSWLFPDHTAEARRMAPEAHAEWDRLQAEINTLSAEHVWGKVPTPEEAASPEYQLEQRLREHVLKQLPVSWDLRVAADLQAQQAGPDAMLSLGPTEHAPQGFRGVHSTHADIGMIEKEKFGTSADAGYWGRGFYMHPYELAKGSKTGIFYGGMKEGAKNYLVDVDSKNPFYIHNRVAQDSDLRTNWESLHAHGWTHDKAPVSAWNDRSIYEPAEKRVPQEAKDRLARAEKALEQAHSKYNEIVDWNDKPLPGKTEEEVSAANKAMADAYAEEKAARELAGPNSVISQDFTDALLKAGYDSVIVTNNGKPYEMVGIKPGTLKSTFGREAMYSFGGVGAKEPPKGLGAAKRMERKGELKENIWRETGWHKSPDGKWRFEIDDSKADFHPEDKNTSRVPGKVHVGYAALPQVLDHPELYKQYPHLMSSIVKIKIDPNLKAHHQGYFHHAPDLNGGISIYVEARDKAQARNTLIHEIQHSIQKFEGEPSDRWGSPEKANLHGKYADIVKEVVADFKKAMPNASAADHKYLAKVLKHEIYLHSSKEIEARISQERGTMSEDERKQLPPFPRRENFIAGSDNVHNIVKKHLGTELFDYLGYRDYLQSAEFKARQVGIDERNARVRAALDERKAQVEGGYEAADAKAKLAEEKARKAQEKLDAFLQTHAADLEKQEKARLAVTNAEADLFKANERLSKAKSEVADYERDVARHQKEMEGVDREKAMVKAVLDDLEKERQARIEEEKRRNPSAVEQGMADPNTRTAWISAMAKDPRLVAREESGHAIRASGLFKPEEWGILRDAAINKGWLDAMPKEIRERYEEAYAHRGEYGVRDAMVEEAIMHRFAAGPEAWGPQGGVIARFMERIKNLLERVGNWLTSRGFQSASDVFDAMESGQVSARDTMQPHAARRIGEIEARMNELRPTILDAYKQAKEAKPIDLPSMADAQRALWKRGFAHAATDNEVANMLEHIYGPKTDVKAGPTKPGELPLELQVQERRLQTMVEEGYKPTPEEIAEHTQTQAALQEAMALEQAYQQAAECLITSGI